MKADMVALMSGKVAGVVRAAILEICGQNDLIILSALGIDSETYLLDCFIQECEKIKKEIKDES